MTAGSATTPGDAGSYGPAADAVLRALRHTLAAGAIDGWIVGGAVRERLRGRATHDVDVALAGDGDAVRDVTRAVTRAVGGHAFPLSDTFGAWRATSRPGDDAPWQLDVTPLQGADLADDLTRRDLTVNALAEPVGGGAVVDLFGGRDDLAASVLRLVAPDALERDPVRVVRLARFAAELQADPDAAALDAARAAAPALSAVPGERVLPELLRALTGAGWERGLRVLVETGALAALLPGTPEPDGALPVVVERVLRAPGVPEAAPDDAAALRRRAAGSRSREVLALAALLSRSADAGAALDGLRPSRELRTGVARAVAAARRIAGLPGDAGPEALFAALGPAGTDAPEAVLLARALATGAGRSEEADRRGTAGPRGTAGSGGEAAPTDDAAPPWAALAARAVRWAAGPPRPPVSGDALARELGLRPGPELGRLLRTLAVAHDAGELDGPEDAFRLARTLRTTDAGPPSSGG